MKNVKIEDIRAALVYLNDKNVRDVSFIMTQMVVTQYAAATEDDRVDLSKYQYDIISPVVKRCFAAPPASPPSNPNDALDLVDQSVVFSGFRSEKLKNYLETHYDINVQKNIRADTDILILKDQPNALHTTRKHQKAINQGINIMTMDELNHRLGVADPSNQKW